MNVKPNFGGKDLPLVFKGDKLVYPNPVKDGLVLWYDFAGMRNTNLNREVAKDLSGNENHGTLQNFNFTAESGYDKNRLLFDGVDDKLQIPELNLDETGMTVGVDGKVYAYEDDKVVTVRNYSDDSRTELEGIEVGGRNYLQKIEGIRSSNVSRDIETIDGVMYWTQKTTATVAYTLNTYAEDIWDAYTLTFKTDDISNIRRYLNTPSDGTVVGVLETKDFDNHYLVSIYFQNINVVDRISFYGSSPSEDEIKAVMFWDFVLSRSDTAIPYSPAPEDFQTTSLSPPSLSKLQLYNRPLRKNELLQNTESAGLKELVDGVPVQDGLVLHYDFSKENNTSEYREKAFDYSGNGNHGILNNFNFTDESGYVDDGLHLDGVDDSIDSFADLSGNYDGFTVQTTIKPENPSNGANGVSYIFHWNSYSAEGNAPFALYSNSGGSLIWQSQKDVNSNHISYSNALSYGEKTIVTAIRSRETLLLYLNGVEVARAQLEKPFENTKGTLGIGDSYGASGYRQFDGTIHSTYFYNRALTPEEIAHNYQIEKERFDIE